jgi:hypothetical protein
MLLFISTCKGTATAMPKHHAMKALDKGKCLTSIRPPVLLEKGPSVCMSFNFLSVDRQSKNYCKTIKIIQE